MILFTLVQVLKLQSILDQAIFCFILRALAIFKCPLGLVSTGAVHYLKLQPLITSYFNQFFPVSIFLV